MPADVLTYLQAGLAQGHSLEAIIAAALAQLGAGASQPTLAPDGPATGSETIAFVENREARPDTAVTLPGALDVPPDTPRVTVAAGSPAGVRAGAAQGDVADAAGQASYRVFRGGSWSATAPYLRASLRSRHGPSIRNLYLGFRLARSYPWLGNP